MESNHKTNYFSWKFYEEVSINKKDDLNKLTLLFSTGIPKAPRCAIACCCETLLFFFRLLLLGSGGRDGLGPHHAEHTPSRPIWEVKQRRARLVLAWVTGWEYRVSKPPFGFGLRFRQCD